ncbi:MAG: sigma-70 family RNA polymerase sigma factor [Planctomycetes bacterium]|nr:sigma-70 family RNA polymerase sigma factor [Planctomycetota bacterium]
MDDDGRVCREQTWRAAVLAGDERAWRAWYDESFEPLRAFVVWRLARQPVSTDEVLQETWLIAVRRMKDFDPRQGAFLDWLRGIAGNLIRNLVRQQQSTTFTLATVAANTTATVETGMQWEADERAARVSAALLALPEHYAAVLRAKYLDQQSVAEIAEAWNQTAKGIESLLTRARLAFREQFGEET